MRGLVRDNRAARWKAGVGNGEDIPRARCTCGEAIRLPEAEGRAPKGAQAAARVRKADALAGVGRGNGFYIKISLQPRQQKLKFFGIIRGTQQALKGRGV
jgi:hypothetical protein